MLTEIIARNERIPVDKVDEWVEKCLIYAARKGIIKYDGVRKESKNRTV